MPEIRPIRNPNVVPINLKLPKRSAALLSALIILFVIVVVAYNFCFVYVHPNEYGIKKVKIGVNRGIQKEVYGPGLAFVMPFGFEEIHRLPRNVQVLELSAEPAPSRIGASHYYGDSVKIQTSDGFSVDVDVTILFKITDPYLVITTLGPGRLFLDDGILPKAEPMLKEALGELTAEDFFQSPLRVSKVNKARGMLDSELQQKGISVDYILVRYFKYSQKFQDKIEAKKLEDQLVFKNQAEAKAATEEANLKRIVREGEMNVKVTLQGGEAYKVKKNAGKELYSRRKYAEADLLIKLAEAKRTQLKNEAMQVAGSDKMVAMKMAEVLKGLDTIIIPSGGEKGLNPLDLDQMLKLFGANTLVKSASTVKEVAQ